MIAAVILAAGASSRMGSPKALLEYRAETFVGRLARILHAAGCDPVIVVLGHQAERIASQLPAGVTVALNPDPARGQLSSLQTALALLPAEADGFCFTTVDCPAVAEETVRELVQAFGGRDAGTDFVIPRFGDKRGHPVFATGAMAQELLRLPASAAARDVVHAHVASTRYIDVNDAGILADIDDAAAYRQLQQERA